METAEHFLLHSLFPALFLPPSFFPFPDFKDARQSSQIEAFGTHASEHTVILRALTYLDKGPETGGFSRELGVVGIISIFMY